MKINKPKNKSVEMEDVEETSELDLDLDEWFQDKIYHYKFKLK